MSASYVGEVPNIFKIADQQLKSEQTNNRSKRPPRIMPMPGIEGRSNVKGPIIITQDFLNDWDDEKEIDNKRTKRDYERAIIELLAKKARLESKLTDLNPKKKKDSKKIASFNVQLRDIEEQLDEIQEESGIDIDNLETGSKLSRFIKSIKKKAKKIWKKVKKFWKKHNETIIGILTIAIPSILTILVRKTVNA